VPFTYTRKQDGLPLPILFPSFSEVEYKKTMEKATFHRIADNSFKGLTIFCSALILILMAGFFVLLFQHSKLALSKFGVRYFFTSVWNPVTHEFGAASSIFGTLVSTVIALVIAIPLSIAIAIFLSEIAHPLLARIAGQAIELLAAIPSIIYGMWGLFVFAPFMSDYIQPFLSKYIGFLPFFQGPPMGIGMLTAGIVLALMVLPFMSSIMRDVVAMVPGVVKEAGYGMGGTMWEVSSKITIRYGISGILGAIFLGLGRAIGETMAVTFVIGNNHSISASLYKPANSIASTLANEFAEASDPLFLSSLMCLGFILLIITFLIQVIAHYWLKRLYKRSGAGL
jgi:phosphate transport system permease protein